MKITAALLAVAVCLLAATSANAFVMQYGQYQYPGFPAIKMPPPLLPAPGPGGPGVGPAGAGPPKGTGKPAGPPLMVAPPTLAQDITELYALVNLPAIEEIIHRYLRNDREFQTLVRIWNSYNFTMLKQQLYMQPEFAAFKTLWDAEMLKSGGPEELEMEGIFFLTNPNPFWGNQVNGIAGFVQEVRGAANEFFLRQHINRKLMMRGSLYTVYASLVQLPAAIDRVLATPEGQAVLNELTAEAIDLKMIVQPIYSICGFPQQLPQCLLPPPPPTTTTTTTTTTTVAPVTAPTKPTMPTSVAAESTSTSAPVPAESSSTAAAPAVVESSSSAAPVPAESSSTAAAPAEPSVPVAEPVAVVV